MKRVINYILVALISLAGLSFANNFVAAGQISSETIISAVTSNPPAQTKPVMTEPVTLDKTKTEASQAKADYIDPIIVVNRPSAYLNKRINVVARFDKFATLGLDYKPAFRSSENYISFLILRSDTTKNIPLSEMKLFMKRTDAEKFIELKEGDKVQLSGVVFSNALGDVWVDVDYLKKFE